MSYNDFHNKEEGCNISSYPRGQFDSLVVFNKNVGFKKPRVSWYQESNLEIRFETKKCNYCQILTRVSGCRSRQGIQAYQDVNFSKWKVNSNIFRKLYQMSGTPEMILFVSTVSHHPNTFQSGHGCFSDILGSQVCVYFPLFHTHRKDSQKVNQDQYLLLIITQYGQVNHALPGF